MYNVCCATCFLTYIIPKPLVLVSICCVTDHARTQWIKTITTFLQKVRHSDHGRGSFSGVTCLDCLCWAHLLFWVQLAAWLGDSGMASLMCLEAGRQQGSLHEASCPPGRPAQACPCGLRVLSSKAAEPEIQAPFMPVLCIVFAKAQLAKASHLVKLISGMEKQMSLLNGRMSNVLRVWARMQQGKKCFSFFAHDSQFLQHHTFSKP